MCQKWIYKKFLFAQVLLRFGLEKGENANLNFGLLSNGSSIAGGQFILISFLVALRTFLIFIKLFNKNLHEKCIKLVCFFINSQADMFSQYLIFKQGADWRFALPTCCLLSVIGARNASY